MDILVTNNRSAEFFREGVNDLQLGLGGSGRFFIDPEQVDQLEFRVLLLATHAVQQTHRISRCCYNNIAIVEDLDPLA